MSKTPSKTLRGHLPLPHLGVGTSSSPRDGLALGGPVRVGLTWPRCHGRSSRVALGVVDGGPWTVSVGPSVRTGRRDSDVLRRGARHDSRHAAVRPGRGEREPRDQTLPVTDLGWYHPYL